MRICRMLLLGIVVKIIFKYFKEGISFIYESDVNGKIIAYQWTISQDIVDEVIIKQHRR